MIEVCCEYLYVQCTVFVAPASSKEFLDIQATIKCGFTLKCVRDMIRTYRHLNNIPEYSFFVDFEHVLSAGVLS